MSDIHEHIYRFGEFELDPESLRLLRGGEVVPLTLKSLKTLLFLVENHGRVVTREELMTEVWQDAFVEENVLSVNISGLRKLLGDDGAGYIRTLPRQGYQFVAKVEALSLDRTTSGSDFIVERHRRTEITIEKESSQIQPEPLALPKRSSRRTAGLAMLGMVIIAGLALGGWYYLRSNRTQAISSSSDGKSHTSFAGDNKVITDFGFAVETAWAAAQQPDGKIIIAGLVGDSLATADFALARYNVDGSLDKSFDSDGKVVTPLSPNQDIAHGIAIQPDGKILVVGVSFTEAGTGLRRYAIVRYNEDGSLDASFDGDGIVTLNVGTRSMDTAYAVAIQPDGKIVIAGSAFMRIPKSNLSNNEFGLVRLNRNGSIDNSFGKDGVVITKFGYDDDVAYALKLQPDGKIVLAGLTGNGTNMDFGLVRYRPDGTLDEDFGAGGIVRTDFANEDEYIWNLAIQPDGKILAAGFAKRRSTVAEFALARYKADGSLDNSFDGDGKLLLDFRGGNDDAHAIQLQPDGKILVGGKSENEGSYQFGLARFYPDGKPDETFNGSGRMQVPILKNSQAIGLFLMPDGSAVLAGSTGDDKLSNFALLRIPM